MGTVGEMKVLCRPLSALLYLFVFGPKYSSWKRFEHINKLSCWLCQVGHLVGTKEQGPKCRQCGDSPGLPWFAQSQAEDHMLCPNSVSASFEVSIFLSEDAPRIRFPSDEMGRFLHLYSLDVTKLPLANPAGLIVMFEY